MSEFFISLSEIDIIIHFYFEHNYDTSILKKCDYDNTSERQEVVSHPVIFYDSVRQKNNQPTIGSYFYRSVSDSQNNALFHSPLQFY